MRTVLSTAFALLSFLPGHAQDYVQNFEGNHTDILNEGWQFINLEGDPENNGIYSSSSSLQAIGIQGGAAGIATFNLVNQLPTHIDNLDCVIASPAIMINDIQSFASFTTGSVRISSNGLTHYSVYVVPDSEFNTPAPGLKTLLNNRAPHDTANASNAVIWTSLDLESYVGTAVRFIFRVHDSPSNTIFLVDDFRVTNATLGRDNVTHSKLAAYPNPAQNFITINYPGIEEVVFTDINGREVLSQKYNTPHMVQADVSQLSQGIYVMAVKTAYGISTQKVIKS